MLNKGNFTINERKYNQILSLSGVEKTAVDAILFYDWDNSDEHQTWLNIETVESIVNWLIFVNAINELAELEPDL